ncbi:MAG: S9 family peptidase, partial [Acidobacteriota bacterium]|nr:S9 family peptidase [Acidobacteriota bacterium]
MVRQPIPPVAPRVPHTEVRHGETVSDDYFWLREKSNPQTLGYLSAENACTEELTAHLKPFSETLYLEMLGRIRQTDLSVPARRGEYLYYTRTEEGRQYPIQCRRKGTMEAAEEILLDVNELGKDKPYVGLGAFVVSDDQTLLAYTVDYSGFRQYSLRIKDLGSGDLLPDTAERVTALAWAADNRTLFYATEDSITKRSDKLFRHVLGTEGSELLYEEKDELFDIGIGKTRDRLYLVVESESKDTAEARWLRADDPRGEFRILLPREKNHRYHLDHREGLFYIRTNKFGKDFAVVTAPAGDSSSDNRPPHNWQTFIPHREGVRIEHLDLFAGFAVAIEKSEALNRLRVHDFRTGAWRDISFPEPVYTAMPAATPDFKAPAYRYSYQSLVTPPGIYDYDPVTGASTLLKRQEVPGGFDSARYATERLWATARDGVRVPISIVYRRGLVRDGSAPMLLYGYGSYGFGIVPAFSSERVSLLDRGMSFAIAHIRGGDELGERWREDGMLMKKKNTFFDFIDCAEYLIREKWTSKDRLAIEGRSAGGLLMGAVVNLRPDLFRAVHAGVPFVDVMNTMMDASLPLTVGEYLEWGDPGEKAAYDYMKSYSPYDNLKKGEYPAILVTSSLNDSQVMYWEPAKYVARLRTLKTDDRPLLLKLKMDPAGHG